MALFRQLEEAAQKISLKSDLTDDSFIVNIIETIEGITGLDLSILKSAIEGIESLIGGIQTTLNQIGDIFNNLVVTPINNVVSNVKNWFLNLLGFQESTGSAIENTTTEISNQGTAIIGLSGAVDGKANYYDIPNNQPYWMSINPLEDVSFPRGDLDNSVKQINLWGSNNGRYVRPTELVIDGPNLAVTTEPFYWPIANTWEIVFIRAPRDRIYNQVSFMLGAPTTTPAPSCKVVVGKMSLQSGKVGDLIPLWEATDITPSTSNLKHQKVLPFGMNFEARAGEPWFVAILQSSGNWKPLGGKNFNDIIAPDLVFPPRIKASYTAANFFSANAALGFLGSTPVGLKRNQLDFSDNWAFWASLGEVVQQGAAAALTYEENFDRANQDGYGAAWYTTGNNQGIRSNGAQALGTNDGLRSAMYVFPMNYDDHTVEGRATGVNSSGAPATLFIRCGLNMTAGVGFQFNSNLVELYSFIGGYPNGVVSRASASVSVPNGALLRVEAIGNVYRAFVNNAEVLTWVDSGNVMPRGSKYRFWAFGVSRASFTYSAGWDWLIAKDIIVGDVG